MSDHAPAGVLFPQSSSVEIKEGFCACKHRRSFISGFRIQPFRGQSGTDPLHVYDLVLICADCHKVLEKK